MCKDREVQKSVLKGNAKTRSTAETRFSYSNFKPAFILFFSFWLIQWHAEVPWARDKNYTTAASQAAAVTPDP